MNVSELFAFEKRQQIQLTLRFPTQIFILSLEMKMSKWHNNKTRREKITWIQLMNWNAWNGIRAFGCFFLPFACSSYTICCHISLLRTIFLSVCLLLRIMSYNRIHILLHERINDSINKSIWCIASRRWLIIAFRINERKDYRFVHQYLNSKEAKKKKAFTEFSTVHLRWQRYEIERKYLIFLPLFLGYFL